MWWIVRSSAFGIRRIRRGVAADTDGDEQGEMRTLVSLAARTHKSVYAEPAPLELWERVYAADSTASLSQSPEWMAAITRTSRWRDATRAYEMADGRRFVLPLARRGIGAGATAYASLPAGYGMGGVIGTQPLRSEDASLIRDDLQSLGAASVRILPNPLNAPAWQSSLEPANLTTMRYAHVLDVEGGFETVRATRFRRTARKLSNRAMRAGLDVERDTTGRLIPIYRDLFQRSVVRWAKRSGEPLWLARLRSGRQDPPGKLEALADMLRDRMVTWVASYRGEPAAVDILLMGNSVFSWRAAMHEELGPATNAAYLLQHLAIEDACANGAALYYLGESGRSAGSAMFKERFGAVGHAYPEMRIERIPYTRANRVARSLVKRAVGYKDE